MGTLPLKLPKDHRHAHKKTHEMFLSEHGRDQNELLLLCVVSVASTVYGYKVQIPAYPDVRATGHIDSLCTE